MKKKIVIFGNCQAGKLKQLLLALLPDSEFEISNFSNNTRTGNLKSNQEILSAVGDCEILIYQPLSDHHGELSEKNVKKTIKNNCVPISFAYVFNNGVYSLCHAPLNNKHDYGFIFGEEVIIDLLKLGKSKEEIIQDYREGVINFNLIKRFNKCLIEMTKRELSTDIKLADFIRRKYQKEKLFITHNHPSNIVFYEIIRQIMTIVPLSIDECEIEKLTIPDLQETNCPITPQDVNIHNYEFNADEDWFIKGASLIELIVDNYFREQLFN